MCRTGLDACFEVRRNPRGICPLRSEADYDMALEEIERYFDIEPKPGTLAADRFDLLALLIADYENKRWPIDSRDSDEAPPVNLCVSG